MATGAGFPGASSCWAAWKSFVSRGAKTDPADSWILNPCYFLTRGCFSTVADSPCKGWMPGWASEVRMKQVRCLWELPRWSMKLTWAFPKLCHPHSMSFSGLRYLLPHPKPVAFRLLLSVTQSLRWVLGSSNSVPCFHPLRYASLNIARLAEHRIQEHAMGDHHFRSCCKQSVRPNDGNHYLVASVVTGERSVDIFLNNTSGLKSHVIPRTIILFTSST